MPIVPFHNTLAVDTDMLAAITGDRASARMWGVRADAQEATVSMTAGSAVADLVFSTGPGTISTAGTLVTGAGTNFITKQQWKVGGLVKSGADTRVITAIDSDTAAQIDVAFPSPLSAVAYTLTKTSFSAEDTGKIATCFGAGSGSDRESLLTSGAQVQASTDSWTVVTGSELDCQAATWIRFALSSHANSIDWEVWGSASSSFSSETRVHGPTAVAAQTQANLWTTSSPGFRYYRIKIKSTTPGAAGTAYTSQAARGRVLPATIALVNSVSQITLSAAATTTRAAANLLWGTDDTAAWNRALNELARATQGGDHGRRLRLHAGRSLITAAITQPRGVIVEGDSGSGSMILADPSRFPLSTRVWRIAESQAVQQAGSYFTRAENLRIDAQHVEGSLAAESETIQENSGFVNCTLVNWRAKGLRLGTFSCQHLTCGNLWVYPSPLALGDDTTIGLDIDQAISTNMFDGEATVLAQPNYVFGYGTAVRVQGANVFLRGLHVESCRIGLHFATSSIGACEAIVGHATVHHLVQVNSNNPVRLGALLANESRYVLTDAISGKSYTDYALSSYEGTSTPIRVRGNDQSLLNIVEWVPGASASGSPRLVINRWGHLESTGGAESTSPNRIVLNALNYGGAAQGGWLTVGSQSIGHPNFAPTHPHGIFTADSATDTLTFAASPPPPSWAADTVVYVWAKSGGSLPGGLAAWPQAYYVRAPTATTLQLSLTAGGAAVNITSNGSGELYVFQHGAGGFYRLGASRFETRFGAAGNSEGTDPGVLALRADAAGFAYTPWLYADATEWVQIGNRLAANRFRLYQGNTSQEDIVLQRSTNSGGSWTDVLKINLATGRVTVSLFRIDAFANDLPVLTGGAGGGDLATGKIGLANSAHVTVPGSNTDLLTHQSNAVGSITLASLATALAPTLQAIFDNIYAQVVHAHPHNHGGNTGTTDAHSHTISQDLT